MYVNKKIFNKLENFKINYNFIFKSKFLNFIKKNLKSNKFLNILIKLNGCKGYMCFMYISNIKKYSIILNFNFQNILFKFWIIPYIFYSKFYLKKKKNIYYILLIKKLNNICKCGSSFYIK